MLNIYRTYTNKNLFFLKKFKGKVILKRFADFTVMQ